ncbi:hypothetical protein VNO78_12492 [Psophocarpus tetragonolobus]|uniref:Uncharacterized protein n=1 Tax=Psophocarpus tetragonolobus TaxID=3891 RepID=A0AAN9SNF9_PSOTE
MLKCGKNEMINRFGQKAKRDAEVEDDVAVIVSVNLPVKGFVFICIYAVRRAFHPDEVTPLSVTKRRHCSGDPRLLAEAYEIREL